MTTQPNSITLRVDHDDEITLPKTLAVADLTLAEIGAVVVFMSLDIATHRERMGKRLASEEIQDALHSLRAKGVATASLDNGTVNIGLDLCLVIPGGDDAPVKEGGE